MSIAQTSLGAYPIDDLIVRVVEQRLQSLDFVSEVIRETRNIENWTPKDRQILLTKGNPVRTPEFDTIGNPPGLGYSMQVNIRCHILQSELETEPIESLLSIFAADVQRAITAVPDWYRFDGCSLIAQFADIDRISFDGGFDAVNVPINVIYRISENDPYVVRC